MECKDCNIEHCKDCNIESQEEINIIGFIFQTGFLFFGLLFMCLSLASVVAFVMTPQAGIITLLMLYGFAITILGVGMQ